MNIKQYILWTNKKSVTCSNNVPKLKKGDCVKVFCGWCTISRIIYRKDDNITLILK